MDPEVQDLFKTSCTKFLSGRVELVLAPVELRSEGRGAEGSGSPLVGPMKAMGMSSGHQISDKTLTA